MKKGKAFFAAVMTAALAVGAIGCTSNPSANEQNGKQDQSQTENKQEYIIATDTTFAPFEFEDKDGNFVGIDMDLIKAIAKDQEFQYSIQPIGFTGAVQSLQAGQCDAVIAGMSITEERKKIFDFSDPYYNSAVIMGVAESNQDIKGYQDLKGKNVAVKTGTEGEKFASSIQEEYGFTVSYFDDSASMYEDVKTGNSAACFEDYPVLGYGIAQNVGLKMVGEKQSGNAYGIAVGKGKNADLLEKINKGLQNLEDNGEYDKILEKYNAQE